MPTIDLTNLGPEALFVLAALVIVAKLAERTLDILQEVVKSRLAIRNGRSGKGGNSKNGHKSIDMERLARSVEATADWHRTEGPGLVRIMNATADHIRASTSVLELVQRRQEDDHSLLTEVRSLISKGS